MSRFPAVPGDQVDPFNPAALLTRSPLASVAERTRFERLRRGVARALGLEPREHPFDRWLREECIAGIEAEGSRVSTITLFVHWRAWAMRRDVNPDCVPGVPFGLDGFALALSDRGIVAMGKDGRGRRLRGPIRLRPCAQAAQ